jgi:hypothetical protein
MARTPHGALMAMGRIPRAAVIQDQHLFSPFETGDLLSGSLNQQDVSSPQPDIPDFIVRGFQVLARPVKR